MSFKLLKSIAAKRAQSIYGLRKKLPDNPPLGIRVGKNVKFEPTPFILANSSFVPRPSGDSWKVAALGKLRVGDYALWRFYLDRAGEGAYLHFFCNGDKIEETQYFKQHDEIYPESDEDFELWVGKGSGLIGGASLFVDDEEFGRIWGEGDSWAEPLQLLEDLYTDADDKVDANVDHRAMLYGREISQGINEYVFASLEEDPDGVSIQINTGLDIPIAAITVY